MLDGSESDSLLILGTVQVVGEIVGALHEIRVDEAAVLALRGSRTSPSACAGRGPVGVGDIVGLVTLAVGVAVGFHFADVALLAGGPHELVVDVGVGFLLAVEPHELAVDVDVSFALVVSVILATKAKELRAGNFVARCVFIVTGKVNLSGTGNVEDELAVPPKMVVDVQSLLVGVRAGCRVERAIIHVNGDVLLGALGVDFDDLAFCVKGAGVKRHDRRAVRPEGIVVSWRVERRVLEQCAVIAPVERFAFNDAVIDNGVVDADETKVVRLIGVQRHVLERNGLRSL